MLDENDDIDYVLAFHNYLPNSKGTKDLVKKAIKRGIPVYNVKEDSKWTWLGEEGGRDNVVIEG
jgi:hypothetical protein